MERYGAFPIGDGELLLDVLGDVNEDWTGATGDGKEEGLTDYAWDIIHIKDEVIVLGNGASDLNDWGLLEGICADHAARDLASDGY